MSDQSDTSVLGRPEEDWLSGPPADPAADDSPAASPPWSTRRTMAIRAGLVAAGVVVGGVVVTAATHHSSASTPTAATFPPGGQALGGPPLQGTGPQGSGPQGTVPRGSAPQGTVPQGSGPGGFAGEQRLSGTLVSVGSSTVRIRTSAGTSTYAVTSSSEIVRNGQVVTLRALQAGDPVFVHVYPSGSGSRLTVERLFASGTTT